VQYKETRAISMVYCDAINSKNRDAGHVCGVWNCSPKLGQDSVFSCDFTCNSEKWESLLVYSVHSLDFIFMFCRYRLILCLLSLFICFGIFPFI